MTTTDAPCACPGSTHLTSGASWHLHPVTCASCTVAGRVAVWTGTAHVCPRCARRTGVLTP